MARAVVLTTQLHEQFEPHREISRAMVEVLLRCMCDARKIESKR